MSQRGNPTDLPGTNLCKLIYSAPQCLLVRCLWVGTQDSHSQFHTMQSWVSMGLQGQSKDLTESLAFTYTLVRTCKFQEHETKRYLNSF